MNMPTKWIGFLVLALASVSTFGGTTNIAQQPLLNVQDTGSVRPNIMLLYDNSTSMGNNYTPDYVGSGNTMCRKFGQRTSGNGTCPVGSPQFMSADFNRQYYDPAITYLPPLNANGGSYNSMNSANTSAWTAVPNDGFGIDKNDMGGSSGTSTNLVTSFPEAKYCTDTNGNDCKTNTTTYTYPDDTYNTTSVTSNNVTTWFRKSGPPYYWTINVAQYCAEPQLKTCVTTPVGAAAPAGYPYPAKVRWCTDKYATTCQSKYVDGGTTTYRYPVFGQTDRGMTAAYGTITIGPTRTATPAQIDMVYVTTSVGRVAITSSPGPHASSPTGTTTLAEQTAAALSLAKDIIAFTGNSSTPFWACTRAGGGTAPACSALGITLGADNIVAIVPLKCPTGVTKSLGNCTVVVDDTSNGNAVSTSAPAAASAPGIPSTAFINVSGTVRSSGTNKLNSTTKYNGITLLSSAITLTNGATATSVAQALVAAISTKSTTTAYLGGNPVTQACASAAADKVCLVDQTASINSPVTLGSLTSNSGITLTATGATTSPVQPVYGAMPATTAAIGAGGSIFVRTNIIPTVTSYPKAATRTDCAGSSCTYEEEMTNFANWYAYYKVRNQMMKSAIGRAFTGLTERYNVGFVTLSSASSAKPSPMKPAPFVDTSLNKGNRTNWYTKLYNTSLSGSTPMREALDYVGTLYQDTSVVTYPCQHNFTIVTTDGYWNGGAPTNPKNNDYKEDLKRSCTNASGCVDASTPGAAGTPSLADVALYWFNGGSNTSVASLNEAIDPLTNTGQVQEDGKPLHLHMNTFTLGLGIDGLMEYDPDYDTNLKSGSDLYNVINGVQTGCPWNNNGAYVWPDPKVDDAVTSTVQARVDDLWHAAINGHGKYFSASNPEAVVKSLGKALSSISITTGAAAAAATSTPNISVNDNNIFESTFTTVEWYGELVNRSIDPDTGLVVDRTKWSTSTTLGTKVGDSSDTRTIYMLNTTDGTLKDFTYSNTNLTSTEKAWFDNRCNVLAQCPDLTAAQKTIVNSGANVVNWLRGQQQYADNHTFRAYKKINVTASDGTVTAVPLVLGDIATAQPAFLYRATKGYDQDNYSGFATGLLTGDDARQPMVFVAANDGMLHAFDAATGTERWAYAPRITMPKLYRRASTTYGANHEFTTDGSPAVADVHFSDGWRTVLVAGLNGGGRGYYALDVTDPTNPQALWEFCADATICTGAAHSRTVQDPDLGLTFGIPQFGTFRKEDGTEVWAAFVSSGYNNVPGTDGVNTGDGRGYLYVLEVESGAVLAKVSTGTGDTDSPSGFAKITATSPNPQYNPLVTMVYGGDVTGKLYRFDFASPGAPTVITMADAGSTHPITVAPEVTYCAVTESYGDPAAGLTRTVPKLTVAYGTGRLLGLTDAGDTTKQSIYVLKDTDTGIAAADWRKVGKMAEITLSKDAETGLFSSDGQANLSTGLGWFADLTLYTGERVNLDPRVLKGVLTVLTNVPSTSSACVVGGTTNLYQLDMCKGYGRGYDSPSGRVLSSTAESVGFIQVLLPGGFFEGISKMADGTNAYFRQKDDIGSTVERGSYHRVRE